MSSGRALLSACFLASASGCAASAPDPTLELVEIVNAPSCREVLRTAARAKDSELRGAAAPASVDPVEVAELDLPRSSSSTTTPVGRWVRYAPAATIDGWPLGRSIEEIDDELGKRLAELEPDELPLAIAAARGRPAADLAGVIRSVAREFGTARLSFAVRRSHDLPALASLSWEVRRRLELGRISALGRASEGLSEPLEWPPLVELIERCEIDVEQVEDALAVLHAARRPMPVQFVDAEISLASRAPKRASVVVQAGRVRVTSIIGSKEVSLGAPREVIQRNMESFRATSDPPWTWTLELGDGTISDLVTLLSATGPRGMSFELPEDERIEPPALRLSRYPELPASESPKVWRATLRGLLEEIATCPKVATFGRTHAELSISGDGRVSAESIELTSPDSGVEACVRAKLTGFRLLPSLVSKLSLDIEPVRTDGGRVRG